MPNVLASNSQHFFRLLVEPFAQLFQYCWGHPRASQMVSKVLWIVSFPRCTAGPDIVESFFVRFHTTANTDATTPNILGPTMLGVVASVCTSLYKHKSGRKIDRKSGTMYFTNQQLCLLCFSMTSRHYLRTRSCQRFT